MHIFKVPKPPVRLTGNNAVDWAIPIAVVLSPVPFDDMVYAALALYSIKAGL